MKIITNKTELLHSLPETPLSTADVDKISLILEAELAKHGGIGLSANQLGISKRICLINVIDQLILVNPRIIKKSKETIVYAEQCLSIPKSKRKSIRTVRFKNITIECDNLGIIEFGPSNENWKSSQDFYSDNGLLECICVQHEIDHLNGILMTNPLRKYTTTYIAPKKYRRNERVLIELPNGKTEFIKYKKAIPFLENGCKLV